MVHRALRSVAGVVAVAAILVAALGRAAPLAAQAVSPGQVVVTFAATNPELAAYRNGGKVSLQSARAEIKETAERRLLTLYFSDHKNVDCQTWNSAELECASFVLRVTVYLPLNASLAPGKKDDLALIFLTADGPYFKTGSAGSVMLKQTSPTVTGTLALADDKLKVSGDFSAELCPSAPK